VILDELGRGRAWTPWLLIRYAQNDIGLRPIPASDVSWASPDIWVESSDPYGNAVPGEPNFVHAMIFNLGKAPALPTRLDFYWGNPAVGLGPGQMTLIGSEWVEVQLHAVQSVRCNTPWIPIYENGGHECLIVNSTSPILDPITQPFQTTLDRHVGQRNITVLPAGPGKIIKFSVGINNIFPVLAEVAITARVQQVVVAPAVVDAMTPRQIVSRVAVIGAQQEAAREAESGFHLARGTCHLHSTLSDRIRVVRTKGASAYLGQLLLEADRMAARHHEKHHERHHDARLHEVAMGAFEERRLDLEMTIPANARPREYILVHLLQHGLGVSMGGYTIVILVAH
jgi:hypothetical protein